MGQKFLDYAGLSRFIENLKARLDAYVPMERTVCGHDLSQNLDLDAHDVGAVNESDILDMFEQYIVHNIRERDGWGFA